MRFRAYAALVFCCVAVGAASAQWLNHPPAGMPMKNGQPDLAAPAPRTADGKPDLSGVWTTDSTPLDEMMRLFPGLDALAVPGDDPRSFNKYFLNVFADVKQQDVPMTPSALKILIPRAQGAGKDVPTSHCLPAGIPMAELLPTPRRYIQLPGLLVVLYEGNPHRLIYTDGRKHVVDPVPTWMGYSVGTWEGDTLVVDSRGFNDRTWLDAFGHPRTEAMHIVERIHRRDFGHLDIQMTFDDPGAYTKPISIRFTQTLRPTMDVLEYICAENEKDLTHIK